MKRETLHSILSAVLRRVVDLEYCGIENLPREGGLIIATNHMSQADSLLLFINPVRDDLTALVADKYKKYPFFKWVLDTAGIVWLDRDQADFAAFRLAAGEIKAGKALGIAPEGTRSQNGQLLEGKPGTALLAIKTGVPVVPVGIAGTETFFKRLRTLKRPKTRLTFGPAFTLPPLDRANREEQMKNYTDEIMCRIAVLLPPQYWGFYKDHPRLKELLQEK